MLVDVCILAVPLPISKRFQEYMESMPETKSQIVYKLQMPKSQKYAVIGIFLLGSL
jgi:hypothetical protein